MNGNKFATGQILKNPVEVVKGRILAGWAQKSPEPCVNCVLPKIEVIGSLILLFLKLLSTLNIV
jgi:hypothetical protein